MNGPGLAGVRPGDTIYVEPYDGRDRARCQDGCYQLVVTKVGRRWVTAAHSVNGYPHLFCVETGREKTGYGGSDLAFPTLEQLKEKRERERLALAISRHAQYASNLYGLSITRLRSACVALGVDPDEGRPE